MPADRAAVAAMLARAFADDPAFAHIYPDPAGRARLLPRLMALFFASDGAAGLRLVTGGGEAASLWRAPGRAVVGWGELLARAVPLLLALRGATARAWRVAAAVDSRQPAAPGWYLHVLGCDPARQRRGHGAAAVRAGLARAAGRLPCHLETANEANLGFYAGLGFAVTAEWRVEGLRFWSLSRPAD